MEKILNIGNEVLIFKYIREWGLNQDFEHFKRGYVIKSEISDDLSYHGSSWNKMNYTVLGEDGKEYFGNYWNPVLGSNFFMTKEDYIHFLKRKIELNKEKILEITTENKTIQEIIKNVSMQDKQDLSDDHKNMKTKVLKYEKK